MCSTRTAGTWVAIAASVVVVGGLGTAAIVGFGGTSPEVGCTRDGLEQTLKGNDQATLKSWIDTCTGNAKPLLIDAAKAELARLAKPVSPVTPVTPPDKTPDKVPPVTPPPKPATDDPAPSVPLGTNETRAQLQEGTAAALPLKALWKSAEEVAALPLGADTVFSGRLELPQRYSLDITMRRNTRDLLPASHLIELHFTPLPGFTGKGIARVEVPGVKRSFSTSVPTLPLTGRPAKVGASQFQIVLPSAEPARSTNLKLLGENRILEFTVTYDDNQQAVISIARPLSSTL